jgi:hypothetical protein
MKEMLKQVTEKVKQMDKKQRLIRICELSVKEMHNKMMPDEILELSLIHAIREANGEISEVLEEREKMKKLGLEE